MKISSALLSILSLGLMAGLSSCGSSGVAVLTRPTAPSGTLTSAVAGSFASAQGTQVAELGAGSVTGEGGSDFTSGFGGTMNKNLLSRLISSSLEDSGYETPYEYNPLTESCAATKSGTQTDGDGDGIPVDTTYTFSCNTSSNGFTVSGSGSAHLVDKDDTKKAGGFTVTASNISVSVTGSYGGTSYNLSSLTNANIDVTKGSDGVFTGKYDVEVAVTNASDANSSITLGYYVDTKVTPGASFDATAGKGAGTLNSISGFVKVTTAAVNYVLSIAGTNLTFDTSGSCKTFTGGTLTFTDGSSNSVTIAYDSNCTATSKFNGTAIGFN